MDMDWVTREWLEIESELLQAQEERWEIENRRMEDYYAMLDAEHAGCPGCEECVEDADAAGGPSDADV